MQGWVERDVHNSFFPHRRIQVIEFSYPKKESTLSGLSCDLKQARRHTLRLKVTYYAKATSVFLVCQGIFKN